MSSLRRASKSHNDEGDSSHLLHSYAYKGSGEFEPQIRIDEYVFRLLEEHGPMTRGQLMGLSGVPRTTLYDTLVRLMLNGKVEAFPEARTVRGRPKVYYRCTES